MDAVICGSGPMGTALADELRAAGHRVRVLGRPAGDRHDPADLAGDVVIDFSVADAVAGTVRSALEAGCRRFVIGTTAWEADRPAVDAALRAAGAAAVAAPTFSPGVTALLRVVEELGAALARIGGYDPYVVEWHRAGKRDRPSGTALELAGRLVAADPARTRIGVGSSGPADPAAVEVVGVRAGAWHGSHLVGWDAAGETVELRVTARDRRAYAIGAIAAAEWLLADRRSPGIHTFESVLAVSGEGQLSRTLERTAW